MKFLSIASIFLLFSLLFISCSENDEEYDHPDAGFIKYISSFTSGTISKTQNVVIQFTNPVNGVLPNSKADASIFKISPEVEGDLVWVNDKRLEFKSKSPLNSGEKYKVKIFLNKIIQNLPEEFETFKFRFSTVEQNYVSQINGLTPVKENDLRWQNLNGTVEFADFVNENELEDFLQVTQEGKKLNVKWIYSKVNNQHSFTIISIERKNNKSKIELQWAGSKFGKLQDKTEIIDIPSIKDFTVFSVQVDQGTQQKISIFFSDPIHKTQNLNGLVYLSNGYSIQTVIEGNELIIYPNQNCKGNVQLNIDKAFKNIMGYRLKKNYKTTLSFNNYKPAVRFMGNGNIIPTDDKGLTVPFQAVNLKKVYVKVIQIFEQNVPQFLQINTVEGDEQLKRVGRIVYRGEIELKSKKNIDYSAWNTFGIQLDKLFKKESGAIYCVVISFNSKHSIYPCDEPIPFDETAFENKLEQEEDFYNTPPQYSWDYYDDEYYYDEYYDWQERENPCHPTYYQGDKNTISKNILVSDFGIVVKGGSNTPKSIVFVSDLKTTEAVKDAKIKVLNLQQQVIYEGVTDVNGEFVYNSNPKPFMVIVEKNGVKGYLKLDEVSALSTSVFDVSGTQNKKGIKGFIYGERGVWRPGDSLYLNFVLEDKNKVLPANHPVVMEITNAKGQMYKRMVKKLHVGGVYDFRCRTLPDDETGNWNCKVMVGGNTYYKSLKIENIKPNRLKIEYDFKKEFLSNQSNNIGNLKANWLHGSPGSNLKADVEMTVTSGKTTFKNLEDYTFDDPAKSYESETVLLFEGELNNEGVALIQPKIEVDDYAPGMLNCVLKTRVFENGGDFSIDQYKIPFSPYRNYVGIKVPKGEGWNGALLTDKPNLIAISTVNENGTKENVKDLVIEVFELSWRWWWENGEEEYLSSYISREQQNRIKRDVVSTVNGKAMYELKFDKPSWGRKYIRITHPKSGHSSGYVFYTTYSSWIADGSNSPGGAEMLTFNLDKEKYTVAEEVFIKIPNAKKGKALVSIENGSKIIHHFWHDMANGDVIKFKTNEEMSPNAFVSIHLIQNYASKKNDAPLRLYGYQALEVFNPKATLEPEIITPVSFSPNEIATIKIKEKKGKKMTYTLAIVDEGLLDLTRFQTPNPYEHFYAKEALGVLTWDMYKYVLGAYTGSYAGLLALGGSDIIKPNGDKDLQRFKPVVKFFKAKTLAANSEDIVSFKMPNYVGSVRVMVVAVEDGAYGNSEKAVSVKKPLMVLPTIPRTLSPDEIIKVPVTVFAMDKKVKNVQVKLIVNDLIEVVDVPTQSIQFGNLGSKTVEFTIKTKDKIGKGKIKVEVDGNGEKAFYETDILIKANNPMVQNVQDVFVQAQNKIEASLVTSGIKGTNTVMVELSAIPSLNLKKRLDYLIQYPHGCVEQTTSSVFPQLFLQDLLDLTPQQIQEVQSNINEGIRKLNQFQTSSGGLSYWRGNAYADDWGTSYAGHFMVMAQTKGYQVPKNFLSNWAKYQQQMANSWKDDANIHYRSSAQYAQAYRLYTLALGGQANLGAMNRFKEIKDLSKVSLVVLASAYQLSGNKKTALELLEKYKKTPNQEMQYYYTYGSELRDKAMLLELLNNLGDAQKGMAILKEIAQQLSTNNWYSTQTTSYSLLACAQFVIKHKLNQKINAKLYVNQKLISTINSSSVIVQVPIAVKDKQKYNITIENNSATGSVFGKVIHSGIPLKGTEKAENSNLNLVVNYYNMSGRKIDIQEIKQGEDILVETQVTHPGLLGMYQNLALTQIFPSSWEIRNLRMEEGGREVGGSVFDFQDIKDDRVLTYFTLNINETKIFKTLVNATYKGEFYLPAVHCSEMYNNDIKAVTVGKEIKVGIVK